MTIHNHVILSEAKDLKVYVTVDGPTDCEILRYAQDDKPSHSSSLRGIAFDGFTDTRYLPCNSVAIYCCQRDVRDERDRRDKRDERNERNKREVAEEWTNDNVAVNTVISVYPSRNLTTLSTLPTYSQETSRAVRRCRTAPIFH